jgi:MFS family permease
MQLARLFSRMGGRTRDDKISGPFNWDELERVTARSLNRAQWKVLLASNLGWTFDGFELFALFVTVGFALRQLLEPALYPQIPQYAGYILAATVFGWAAGGVIGGIVADYIGRKRTMMLAILAYSLTTGLSALAWDWESFAVLRFLVGVAIGSEWATGASIVSELWPDHARGKGGGLLQCGAGLGGVLASVVWLLIGSTGPGAWRWMYLIGVLPAFVVLWIRRNIPESPRWEHAHEQRREANALRRSGATLDAANVALTRFTVVDLFADRSVRRALVCSLLMMLSLTFALLGRRHLYPDLCRLGRCKERALGALLGRAGELRHHRGRPYRVYQPRLSRRCDRPQADHDAVVRDVPSADPGGLSLGAA